MTNIRTAFALIVLVLSFGQVPITSAAEEETKVVEGAIVNFDQASNTATISNCRNCKSMRLKVTGETQIYVNGKKQPFTSKTEIGGLVDTMYTVESKTVVWFRPLKIRRN